MGLLRFSFRVLLLDFLSSFSNLARLVGGCLIFFETKVAGDDVPGCSKRPEGRQKKYVDLVKKIKKKEEGNHK